ncbi:hypothetical protein FXO38_15850 [Capsicum annuum]|nr:hypothetical protein FXO38_15850 [Capsicum annuum]
MTYKAMGITEFVKHYEQRTTEMRDIETAEDYKSRGMPKISIEDCGMLKHAASVYTRRIYTRFQHEFLQGATERTLSAETNGNTTKYTILKGENGQTEVVQFNSLENLIIYSCHMFESMGWLCCHALKVLFFDLNFSYIPEKYILKRWSKNAKHGDRFEEYTTKKKAVKSSMAIRLNGLMKESFDVMTLEANDEDSEEIARKYLYQARIGISKHQSEIYNGDYANYISIPNRRYQNGIKDMSLLYSKACSLDLVGYGDVGYLSDPHNARSQTDNVFICRDTAISWRYINQSIVATSLNHVEIISIHEASRECVWLRSMIHLIREKCGLKYDNVPIILYRDNATYIAHLKGGFTKGDRTKHILPKLFYIHELQKNGDINMQQIRSSDNVADLFTKSSPIVTFKKMLHKIGM